MSGGRDLPLMDLRDLDLERMRDNLEYALESLGVQDATFMYVNLAWWDGRPKVQVYVHDPFDSGAVGYLNATLSGKIFQEYPSD